MLSAEAEELLTNAGEVTGYFRETFGRLDNGEMDWGTVKVDGEPVALSRKLQYAHAKPLAGGQKTGV